VQVALIMELATDGNLAERLHPRGYDNPDKPHMSTMELLQVMSHAAVSISLVSGLVYAALLQACPPGP
jgi:hypothetical protein